MFFCFKQHLIFGVIMIIILISFLKKRTIFYMITKLHHSQTIQQYAKMVHISRQ